MKKGLLGSSALIGATVLMAGVASAAEAPTWKLTGNANFQFYYVDQDSTSETVQEHGWYFGVDESELQLNVSGTADNGLNYGFKIEIQTNTTDNTVADEVRLQLSGTWGTVQMGDEDGAEDIMNYGGENLMGATGGFDGDYDDALAYTWYPTMAGDTSDHTKVSYFSPRFSGFQVGASLTPQPGLDGDDFKEDGDWENAIGLGANYDNSFGDLRIRASAVYATVSSTNTGTEDKAAWSVGGIVGWGPASLGANYTDNGDSGVDVGDDENSSYWNVAGSFETGPMYFSVGYMSALYEEDADYEFEYTHIALTADYTVAPGLSVYAEYNIQEVSETGGWSHDASLFIAGANISF
ncbi:MAG: porin [Proteobacteria bacterium]|nr:porin [Pseudomonadota bacterium]